MYYVPCNEIAAKLGTEKAANMVMLGAYLKKTGLVDGKSVIARLAKSFGEKKAHLIPMNEKALEEGAKAI